MEQLNSGENLKQSDIYRVTWKQWAEKTDLEKALAVGSQGSPELREEERRLYLDEFPEDVILVLSLREAEKTESLSQVAEALTKPEAKAIILRGDVSPEAEARYFKLAQKHNRRCTVRHDPEFRGEVALIVIRD